MQFSRVIPSLVACLLLALSLPAQDFWSQTEERNLRGSSGARYIFPDKYLVFRLDLDGLNRYILAAKKNGIRTDDFRLSVPQPDGSVRIYLLKDTPVFDDELSKKYPGYYSFTGVAIEGQGRTLKMSVSPFYVNVMMFDPAEGYSYIDPYTQFNATEYIVYRRSDYTKKRYSYTCGVADDKSLEEKMTTDDSAVPVTGSRLAGDCTLRTYRLALACTGEYSAFHGGTKEKVLAAYNASMTRVNGVYETDVAVTMKLVANTDKLIYLNAASDPYTNNSGDAMLDQNQNTIDNVIGSANYDIGHVFSTGGGGIAQLRAPCSPVSKAMGVTGQPQPIGDYFDIDYVAHEMGHQFGANHTQNNNCQRNGSTAIEPGSASSIMGYAGICDPNVQDHSDGYFHGISIQEMSNFIVAGSGNTCAVRTDLDNNKPVVNVSSANYTIPYSTPFALTAIASDPDGDVMTYCWEQVDNETATMPPKSTNTAGPAFRSLSPTTSPVRYFPDLQRRFTQWEVLPSIARQLDFRCTVRDNNITGGCTDEVNTRVNITTQAGPFVVTNPNTTLVSWLVGSTQTVTWDVAKTNLAPVNCTKVDIYLSVDGGKTYPHLLAENVDNTGQFDVVTPSMPTTTAKVMVLSSGNVFFDVSNANFKIISSYSLATDIDNVDVCDEQSVNVNISIQKILDISNPIQLSVKNAPAGLTHSFSINPVTSIPTGTVLTLSGVQDVAPGKYLLAIEAASGAEKISLPFGLNVLSKESFFVQPSAPLNLSPEINPSSVLLSWVPVSGAKDYTVQLSNNPGFGSIVSETNTSDSQLTVKLEQNKVYYWRVRGNTPCVVTDFGPAFSFRTSGSPQGGVVYLKNDALLTDAGTTAAITSSMLQVEGQSPEFITYTLTGKPTLGHLSKSGLTADIGATFTQEDINNGNLSYTHTASTKEDSDFFTFSVIDEQNRWSPSDKFNIKIRQLGLGVAASGSTRLVCFGDNNAVIQAAGFGGESPYTYSLDGVNYQTSPEFTGLGAGTYIVHIKDNLQTVSTSNPVSVTSPDPISLTAVLVGYDISASATGGTGSLVYSIDDNAYSEQGTFSDPGNGSYLVYVRDDNGCKVTRPLTIDIPQLSLDAQLTNDILCFGQKATITCVGSGGLQPYSYTIDTVYNSSPVIQVAAGNYIVKVKDAGGKIISANSIQTANPDQIVVTFTQEKLKVTVSASGGTGKLEYSLTGIQYDTVNVFEFADNGTYRVYVRDGNLCVKTVNISLNVLKDVTVTTRNLTCFGKKDGYIKLLAQNGTFPFRYSFNGGAFGTTREWSNLAAGTYPYVVIDSKNDSLTGTITLTQPDSLIASWQLVGDDLTILPEGGTAPYKYSIDNGVTYLDVSIFNDLPQGTYQLAVKDKNGCVARAEVMVVQTTETGLNTGLSLFPNPFSENLNLELINGEELEYEPEITDLQGRKVAIMNAGCRENPCILELSDLPSGVYMLRITLKNTSYRKLVVKY